MKKSSQRMATLVASALFQADARPLAQLKLAA